MISFLARFSPVSLGCIVIMVLMSAACTKTSPAPQRFGGTWTMNLGERTFLVLSLVENGDKVTGTLIRPTHFQIDGTGLRFSQISAEEAKESISAASIKENHLQFTTVNPSDPNDTSDYELTLTGKDAASLKIVDAPFDAWPVARVPGGASASIYRGWDIHRTYPEEHNVASNSEMRKIFEEDQKVRQNQASLTSADWDVINREDSVRRTLTAKLLADGQLKSAEDYRWAAFIFQHGSSSDDYLLAHTLAMVSVAKGDSSSLWIGAATLDRYLQSAGKPQIYGTQFKFGNDASQEPFNRKLISDSLRRELGVPNLESQAEQYRKMMKESQARH